MKKRSGLLIVVLSLIAMIVSLWVTMQRNLPSARMEMSESLTGEPEDPQARANWEFNRLHDPATGKIPENISMNELAFAKTLPTRESMALGKNGTGEKNSGIQLSTWSARGPYNVGGRSRALAIDVSNTNNILAGGVNGGMWRSADGGTTWSRRTSASDLQSVTCIAQDTRSGNTSTWYYGTGENLGSSASASGAFLLGNGIFKSIDNGLTWSQLASTTSSTPQTFDNLFEVVWNVATDPSNGSQAEVYASTYGAVQRSTDGGTSWSIVLGGSGTLSPLVDVAVTSTGVVYAAFSNGTTQGIWRSPDGTAWTNITPTGWPGTYNRTTIGIAASNENVVYFLSETPGSGLHTMYAGGDEYHSFWKYTYVSGDGSGAGGTWVNRSSNLPVFGQPVGDFASQGGYDLVVKVKPDNENVVFVGGTNLYRSTDGFATSLNSAWVGGYSTANDISQFTNHHADQHSLAFLPGSPAILLSGHDGGLSKTTNDLASSITWTSLNNGYFTTQLYAVAVDQGTNANNVVISGMQDNGSWFTNSTTLSQSWVSIGSGDGGFCAIADGRTSYYVSSQNANIYRLVMDNNGAVSGFTKVTPTGASGFLFVNPFVLDPNNTGMMYLAGGSTVWRNSDLTGIPLSSNSTTTVNWTQLTNTLVSGSTITALGISKTTANRLYYGTNDGKIYRIDGANSGNPSPVDIWTGKGLPASAYVSSIAVDQTNNANAMVSFSNYGVISIYYTTNSGTNWTSVSGNLEQNVNGTGNGSSVRSVCILPGSGPTMYFAGTSTGLYSTSALNGTSTAWAQEGASTIGNVVVDMVIARQSDQLVIAGTHGNGIYSANASGGGGVTTADLIYDDGTPSGGYYWSTAGQSSANRMTPTLAGATLSQISIYFTSINAGTATYTPIVLQSNSGTPGSALATLSSKTASSVPGWDITDVSASNISVPGDFFVGIKYDGTNEPVFGYDTSPNNGRSWDNDGSGWAAWTETYFMRAKIQTVTSVAEIDTRVPKEFQLFQNYPNPFNPSTIIRYALPEARAVEIIVYDLAGRKITELANNRQSPGTYEIEWNGKNDEGASVASGVYLARIKAGEFAQTVKMMLLK